MVAKKIKTVGTMNGTTSLANDGVHLFDGFWIAYCGKCNTWSGSPNAHTTGFHDAALLDGVNYVSLALIDSTTIIPPTRMALELQLLL